MDLRKTIPRVATGIFLFNEDKILIFKSHKWNNQYCVPGGHVDFGETTQECVIRETKEETGVNITNPKLIKISQCIFPKDFYEKRHFIFYNYIAKTNETNVILNEEAQEYEWVSLNKVLEFDLGQPTQDMIKQIIRENLINK